MIRDFIASILQTQTLCRNIIQRKMREHKINVTFEMLHVLKYLDIAGKVNQQELAKLAYKDKSSLSYLINTLEKRELVKREVDPNDKRNKMIVRTEKGDILYAEVKSIIEDVYQEMTIGQNPEHIQQCIEYMTEFKQNLKIKKL